MLHALFVEAVCAGLSLLSPVVIILCTNDRVSKEWLKEIVRVTILVCQLVVLVPHIVSYLRVRDPDAHIRNLVHDDHRVLLGIELSWSVFNLLKEPSEWGS